jgi:uncharacterized phage-associated protein
MTTVFDVAAKIAELVPAVQHDSMRLQKLVYYAQAWSLVWDERPLFSEPIEAWTHGPVVSTLYGAHKHDGGFRGNPDALGADALATISAVVAAYGDKPGTWLSELAHREQPWLAARRGLPREAASREVITHESMRSWYGAAAARQSTGKGLSRAYLLGLEVLVETPENEVALLRSNETTPGDAYVAWLENGNSNWPDES